MVAVSERTVPKTVTLTILVSAAVLFIFAVICPFASVGAFGPIIVLPLPVQLTVISDTGMPEIGSPFALRTVIVTSL